MNRSFFVRLSLLALAVTLSSCAAGFRSDWKQAIKEGPKPGVEGAWEGTWLSHSNAHTGKLRAVVGPDLGNGVHDFHYHATWKGFLSAAFKAQHTVKEKKDGTHTFAGHHDMPKWAGGRYQYDGKVVGDDFRATYKCSMDHGVFSMNRVDAK